MNFKYTLSLAAIALLGAVAFVTPAHAADLNGGGGVNGTGNNVTPLSPYFHIPTTDELCEERGGTVYMGTCLEGPPPPQPNCTEGQPITGPGGTCNCVLPMRSVSITPPPPNSPNIPTCVTSTCPPGSFLVGIDANGHQICHPNNVVHATIPADPQIPTGGTCSAPQNHRIERTWEQRWSSNSYVPLPTYAPVTALHPFSPQEMLDDLISQGYCPPPVLSTCLPDTYTIVIKAETRYPYPSPGWFWMPNFDGYSPQDIYSYMQWVAAQVRAQTGLIAPPAELIYDCPRW